MAEYHFPVPGSVDEAKIVLFVRRHWASFIGQALLSVAMFLAPIIIFIILHFSDARIHQGDARNIIVLVLSIYYLITLTVSFVAWISFYYDIYIVSEDAIIDVVQEGFFGRKISQQSLLRVQDVTSNIEGFLATFFSYGDVLVETAGEQSQHFLIKNVPNPQEVAAKIMELHNSIIETEGRHHQILEAEGALAPGTIRTPGGHHAGEGHPASEPPASPLPSEPPLASAPPPVPPASPPPPPVENPPSAENPSGSLPPSSPSSSTNNEGEISHDDLDKGGQIDFK